MRITRDLETAALARARRWSLPEFVTLVFFLLWCLTFVCCGLLLLYGVFLAFVAAWRQWLDVILGAAIFFVSLTLLGWMFYHFCRLVEFWCRPKIEKTHP